MKENYNEIFNGVRYPFIGNLEITRKCQLRCKICYTDGLKKEQMNFKEIKKIIDSLKKRSCIFINITGGEPLKRKDFIQIYKYIVRSGIRPSVESNGIILDNEHLKMLREYPPDTYKISLYSIDNVTYQEVTQKKVDVDIIKRNILRLKEIGINIIVRTPVTKDNYMNVYEVSDFLQK